MVAAPDERRRGEALADACDHARRLTAALQAALEGEHNSRRVEVLKRAIADVAAARRTLEAMP